MERPDGRDITMVTISRVEKKFHRSYTAVRGWGCVEKVVRDYVQNHLKRSPPVDEYVDTMLAEACKKLKTGDDCHATDLKSSKNPRRNRMLSTDNEELENIAFDFAVYDRASSVYGICVRTRPAFKFPENRDSLDYLNVPMRIKKRFYIPPREESPEPRVLQGGYVFLILKHDRKRWFMIDFEPIVRALDSILDVREIKGEDVAQKMLEEAPPGLPIRSEYGDSVDAMLSDDIFVLQNKNGIKVTIRPDHGIKMQHPRFADWGPPETRSIKGSVFRGQLQNHALSHPPFPYFRILVHPEKPIWERGKEEPLIELTTKIWEALLPLVGGKS